MSKELYEALRLFVADERFVVTMGGNPIVVERAIEQAHTAIRNYEHAIATEAVSVCKACTPEAAA